MVHSYSRQYLLGEVDVATGDVRRPRRCVARLILKGGWRPLGLDLGILTMGGSQYPAGELSIHEKHTIG